MQIQFSARHQYATHEQAQQAYEQKIAPQLAANQKILAEAKTEAYNGHIKPEHFRKIERECNSTEALLQSNGGMDAVVIGKSLYTNDEVPHARAFQVLRRFSKGQKPLAEMLDSLSDQHLNTLATAVSNLLIGTMGF
jgi:hypothetical protein